MNAEQPSEQSLQQLVGDAGYTLSHKMRAYLDDHYELEPVWDDGWKEFVYQCRYRRGGRTLCTLLYRPDEVICLIVMGAKEREKVTPETLSEPVRTAYEEAKVYHDGKWMWFPLKKEAMLTDLEALLAVKRKPVHRVSYGERSTKASG